MEQEPIEVLKEYIRLAASYSLPIFWGYKAGDTFNVNNNGTAFILNTGQKRILVTAAHVYRSYINHKVKGKAELCQLANISFDLEERLLSIPSGNSIDIATFRITEKEIQQLGAAVLRGSNKSWPPPRPEEQNMVIIAGFPGLERIRRDEDAFSFGYYCFNTPISSISDLHFGCCIDRQFWVDVLGCGFPPENYDMGGISGAPAIALVCSEAGIVSWRLAGVVYEANTSEFMGEILFANHVEYIQSNGYINEFF